MSGKKYRMNGKAEKGFRVQVCGKVAYLVSGKEGNNAERGKPLFPFLLNKVLLKKARHKEPFPRDQFF
jgi:hypothetical protein